jgi:hypothetical protein
MVKNRVLICTFLALTSGFFSSYLGGQITLSLHYQKCQKEVWGVKEMCSVWETPGAMWQGSKMGITGLWTGTILGGFFGGLITQVGKNGKVRS